MVREGGVVLTLFTKPKWRGGGCVAVVASIGVGGGGMVVAVVFVKGVSRTERSVGAEGVVVLIIVSCARTEVHDIQNDDENKKKSLSIKSPRDY